MRYYYIMHKDFAGPILPRVAWYDNETLALTGTPPENFEGEVVRICDLELSSEQLTDLISKLKAEDHTGKLVILSISQGKWLYSNHPDFMPKQTNQTEG